MPYKPHVGSTYHRIYNYLLKNPTINRKIIKSLIEGDRIDTSHSTIDGILAYLKRRKLITYNGVVYVSNIKTESTSYKIINKKSGDVLYNSLDFIDTLQKARDISINIDLEIRNNDGVLMAHRIQAAPIHL